MTYSWCPYWAAECRGSSPELVGLLASAFLVNSIATISLWPCLLASCSAVTPSHVCMFTSAPTGKHEAFIPFKAMIWNTKRRKYFVMKNTFSNKVTQCPHLSSLSCYNEGCDAVGIGWIDWGPSSQEYLTDLYVVPGYSLVEGCPTLTAPLVHSGTERQNEAHRVHILQLTGYTQTHTDTAPSHCKQLAETQSSALVFVWNICCRLHNWFHSCTFVQRRFFVLAADVRVGACFQKALHTWRVFAGHSEEQGRLLLQGAFVYRTWMGCARKYTYHTKLAEWLPLNSEHVPKPTHPSEHFFVLLLLQCHSELMWFTLNTVWDPQ